MQLVTEARESSSGFSVDLFGAHSFAQFIRFVPRDARQPATQAPAWRLADACLALAWRLPGLLDLAGLPAAGFRPDFP